MARSPDISDFATKLGLVLDRLNWSRAQLAQKVGVDKSVAQRWAGGQMVPGGTSLVALTAAIQAALPDFTRADWRLPTARFAARLGVTEPAPPATPEAVAALFPHATALAEATLDSAVERYAGFWLLLHASVQVPEKPGVVGYLASIAPQGRMLWTEVEGSLQGTWRAAGPVFALHKLVYLALEDRVQGDSLAFCVLTGVNWGRAMVLDGIASSAASSLRGPVAATRMIGIRLDDHPAPSWRAEALRRLVRLNAEGLAARLPESLVARFRLQPFDGPRAMVVAVSAEASLACDADEICQGLAPDGAAAVAAVRALFGR
jgi:transcriptional regulator with XRE-family HTH domain